MFAHEDELLFDRDYIIIILLTFIVITTFGCCCGIFPSWYILSQLLCFEFAFFIRPVFHYYILYGGKNACLLIVKLMMN